MTLDDPLPSRVARAREGDPSAFSEIVALLQDRVIGYAWSLLRDYQRAEDAAQEAFLEAHLHLAELRDPAAFAPWLRAITFSKCQRMLRRPDPTGAPAPAIESESLRALDLRHDLARALDELPEAERSVVTLFYLAELDQRTIAQFLEVPISTVKNRLLSARKRLQERLLAEFAGEMRERRNARSERFRQRVALFQAVDTDDARAVERLLAADPTLVHERRRRDEEPPPGVRWGVTALHLAAKEGRTRVAELLIDAGADMEARGSGNDAPGGGTALHVAAKWGKLEVAKLLVERGANVNPDEDTSEQVRFGGSGASLHLFRHREIAEHLIAHGAKITIFTAVALDLPDATRAIVAADPGALVSRQFVEFTPLHLAAREDRARMAALLLDLGAPLAATDRLGRTPLDVALLAGRRRTYELLRERGASPSAETLAIAGDIDRAEKLAHFFNACLGDPAAARSMIDSDPSLITAKLPYFWNDNYVGGTALHLAAALGRVEIAELLLRAGADREQKDERYGGTPVGWAEEFDRPQMAEFLANWRKPGPPAPQISKSE